MRLRRFPARLALGTVALGALASGGSAGYGQNAPGNGSTEIIEPASTNALADEVHQFVQISSAGYATRVGSGLLNAAMVATRSPNGAGDTERIASVVQLSYFVADLPDPAASSDVSTKQNGTGRTLVLAQFN